jgi:hypothetical protein
MLGSGATVNIKIRKYATPTQYWTGSAWSTTTTLTMTFKSAGLWVYDFTGGTAGEEYFMECTASGCAGSVESFFYIASAGVPILCGGLLDFITEEYRAESGRPNRTHYLRLLNQGKNIIGQKAGSFTKKLGGGTTDGALADGFEMTTNHPRIRIPANVIKVQSIFTAAGLPVEPKTRQELDVMYNSWETEGSSTSPAFYIQEGMHLQFSPPEAVGTFTCIVNAIVNLPDYSDTETISTTPSLWLPQEYQLLPAYYVLSELPLSKETFELGQLRVAKYTAKWQQQLIECADMLGAMGRRELDY